MSAYRRPDRENTAKVALVPTDRIRIHPRNIRQTLGDLHELAESIRYEGVLVPLMAHAKYQRGPGVQDLELLHGHRRLAAATIAGVCKVPVVIVPYHEPDAAISLMLAENVCRANLSSEEKRAAVVALHDEFGHAYSAIAERMGVTETTVRSWARATKDSRDSATPKSTVPRRVRPPLVKSGELHAILAQFDDGTLDETAALAAVRALLRGWGPTDEPAAGAVVALPEKERAASGSALILGPQTSPEVAS